MFGDTFGRTEPRELCELYLQGLLSNTQRKNVEAIALALDGPDSVRNLQRFVSEYRWNESWLGQRHWELSAESLSEEQGVWSIDASEFPKKGKASVGVAPQYCGAEGKTANCQSGVFICYGSPKGPSAHSSISRTPQAPTSHAAFIDPTRCLEALTNRARSSPSPHSVINRINGRGSF